ncbi:DUF5686 and carboxypeptidase regulatory-like domain-containing protein [Dyadobacter fermentans]|uniref:Carboxypeptidase-like regulatory domain-containing protein n=1 Tax=Dyadobacter fermentans (strain ATCC 700827 / DSM 18053 / CIP 107007 / KCTC 52180 / NS114) TaxID=471854 RepID=C6W6F4_DYAFD|nr:DUF5686 and carboxypeptidase regulatory-like domain-containing protein [Dyadobacter fermentans]ACT94294.1 hypothetical protein Dfer_3079 [Dyadobacter fermentans DSM 18053]
MLKQFLLTLCLTLTTFLTAFAQTSPGEASPGGSPPGGVRGLIKTQKGEPLPFAAIIVKGTSISTISNEEGRYQLDLKPGYYEVIFQYLGFKTGQKGFTVENKMQTFDLTMEEQALTLGEVRVGARDEDPAYTIMRSAIAKSRYHFLQVDAYTAKVYSKSSVVVTDLPLEFLYKKELKEMEKEANFKKGVPMLNETVSEVTFRQPNVYKQRVVATRSSMDKNMADPNMYLLASFYQPEVVKAVSPLSPRAFAYYKFEYLGAFRENGIEVNKIKVTPRRWGEGVYRGTIQIIEGEWSIYSLDLQTVNTGFRLDIKQVYSPIQGVWMPVNQQFHVEGGIYGFKGKGDFVISQSFTNVKINPTFKPDIVVIDDKKYAEEAKKVRLTGREIKAQSMEDVVSKQKSFSAKNLRKMMKEYEKQDLKEKEKKGEDIDMKMSREDSTQVDSMAARRSMAFWDSLRTVPLTVAEVKSYSRLDSLVIINQGSESQKDSMKTSKADTTKTKKGGKFGLGDLLTGRNFRLGKESAFRLDYIGPLPGIQVNTVEGLVLNGAGLKLRHSGGRKRAGDTATGKSGVVRSGHDWSAGGLTRYSFGRNKLLVTGVGDYSWARNAISVSGGRGIAQFNGENPMHPLLNTLTTLFLEQNFIKEYQKDFFRVDFRNSRENDHFEFKASIEYADRSALSNLEKTSPYRWIDWKRREFTSNVPDNAENRADAAVLPAPMPRHQAFTIGIAASYKPWQKYRTRNGKTSYYDDDSPKLSVGYRKAISAFGGDVNYDFVRIGIEHGFETGIRSKLRYKLAVGSFLGRDSLQFPDYQHFAGNRFFFQLGDPVGTFRMLDYYQYSTSRKFFEAHILSELRQFLLTQITWLRIMGVKENFFLHYLATPDSNNYTELGYGLDIGIRFPLRLEVVNSFEGFKYKSTAFRVGTTMNINWGRN